MIRSILMGMVAGARAMTPLAIVANAARTGRLPADNGAPRILAHPLVSLATTAAATYELIGDKQRSAPDRIIPPAIVIRSLNAAIAGMALAPRSQRVPAALAAGATAIVASYLSFAGRMKAMERYSQVSTGLVEDAIIVSSAAALGFTKTRAPKA